jgi:ribosomal protein S27E
MFCTKEQIGRDRLDASRRREVFVHEMHNDRQQMLERRRKRERDIEFAFISRAYTQALYVFDDIRYAIISRHKIPDTLGHWAFWSGYDEDSQFQSVNCTDCGNYLSWTTVHIPSNIICRCLPSQEEGMMQAA